MMSSPRKGMPRHRRLIRPIASSTEMPKRRTILATISWQKASDSASVANAHSGIIEAPHHRPPETDFSRRVASGACGDHHIPAVGIASEVTPPFLLSLVVKLATAADQAE